MTNAEILAKLQSAQQKIRDVRRAVANDPETTLSQSAIASLTLLSSHLHDIIQEVK